MPFSVTEAAMRPAGNGARECFYCGQPVGGQHRDDCVLVKRKVRVRAIVEYDVDVPASWDAGMIEFHRNDSSWCANNMLDELREIVKPGACLCSRTRFEFVDDVGEPYLEEKS